MWIRVYFRRGSSLDNICYFITPIFLKRDNSYSWRIWQVLKHNTEEKSKWTSHTTWEWQLHIQKSKPTHLVHMDLSSLSSELTAQALSSLGRVLTVATLLMSINSDPLLSENVDSSSCILCEVEKPLLFSEPRPDDLFGQAVALAKWPKSLHWKHSFPAARQSPSW